MKRLVVLVCLLMLISGCAVKYDEDDFIDKTSVQIISEYGQFDCVMMPSDSDGVYRNCRCGYTIKEPHKGFLGTSDEVLLFIYFDENGIAVNCEEGFRPGG